MTVGVLLLGGRSLTAPGQMVEKPGGNVTQYLPPLDDPLHFPVRTDYQRNIDTGAAF